MLPEPEVSQGVRDTWGDHYCDQDSGRCKFSTTAGLGV